MPGAETFFLRGRLRAAGFAPRLFRFRSVGERLQTNADRLAQFAAALPGEAVHFVGYSLGAVVTLRMFETAPPERSGRVVFLGPPLNGSRSALRLAGLPGGKRMLGKCMLDVIAAGAAGPWTMPRDLGIIAGSAAIGLGSLLGALPQPHDGTVCVDETRLAGAKDHLVLAVSHTTMLFSSAVARQVCHFLLHGRFDRES